MIEFLTYLFFGFSAVFLGASIYALHYSSKQYRKSTAAHNNARKMYKTAKLYRDEFFNRLKNVKELHPENDNPPIQFPKP